jgi:DNA-binding PadR family transcriptional regulator
MNLSRYGKRNRKIFRILGFGQKTLARNRRTTVSYKRFIQVFYTTFLVLFYVLIPQDVTAKGGLEKHTKNSHKNAQKDANFLTTDSPREIGEAAI